VGSNVRQTPGDPDSCASIVEGMRIVVDFDVCAVTGGCVHHAPEVFAMADDGMLHVIRESPDESLREAVERAAEYCPTGAITVTD
jgi:ferredoxin